MLFIRYFSALDYNLHGGKTNKFWLWLHKLQRLVYGISLIVLSFFAKVSMASLVETNCGGLVFQIRITGDDPLYKIYRIYYKSTDQSKKLIYKTPFENMLFATCVKNKKNEELLLFNEYPGGNSAPEDMYSVFDPRTKKMLIKRKGWHQGNSKEVAQLLGVPPEVFEKDDDAYFCCFRRQF
jgi:hypothetical protein